MTEMNLISVPWSDYELLDSGENMKLERFGEVVLARPETQALWHKQRPEIWNGAHAEFLPPAGGSKKGEWQLKKPVPEAWEMTWQHARFLARLTHFKHTGVFPEQAPNWEWIKERIGDFVSPGDLRNPHILNLFGYTGIASIVAAQAGTFVTHVDASKQSLDWAHENARLSGLDEKAIRWIPDDALAFAKREVRRNTKYDGIILDPPAFGRGTKGEVWHIEKDLPRLLTILKALLSDAPGSFFLMSGYAAGYSSRAFAQAAGSIFGTVSGESGELFIRESATDRVIPAGMYTRFVR